MARRRDLDERDEPPIPPEASGGGRRDRPFWKEPGWMDYVSVRLLPGGKAFDLRFRGGALVEVPLAALGLNGKALLATPGADPRVVVVALQGGKMLDFPVTDLVAAVDPAFRRAQRRAARAPRPVGAVVRARRRALRLSSAQVAAASGMAPSNYARLEASRHQPRLDTLRRVAAALGVPLSDLV